MRRFNTINSLGSGFSTRRVMPEEHRLLRHQLKLHKSQGAIGNATKELLTSIGVVLRI
jgi:hypothetical protein